MIKVLHFWHKYAIIRVEEASPKSVRSGRLLVRDRVGFVFLCDLSSGVVGLKLG